MMCFDLLFDLLLDKHGSHHGAIAHILIGDGFLLLLFLFYLLLKILISKSIIGSGSSSAKL
jgi:hypothetical protein